METDYQAAEAALRSPAAPGRSARIGCKRLLLWLNAVLCIAILLSSLSALALETDEAPGAVNLELEITCSANWDMKAISDSSHYTYIPFDGGETITLTSEQEISSIYILWNKIPGAWTYSADGTDYSGGENNFLHEYIALETPVHEIVITIPEDGAEITDLHAFSAGTLPDWVQVWQPPCEIADVLLFSTHADDEQLFFAGILPYYAIERQVYVQVVYMTHHWASRTRPHEQLDGLWTVGIRNYPVISGFRDDFRAPGEEGESVGAVLARARWIYNEDDWIQFQVEALRRFKPQVVIGHDLRGEYVHGAHILNSVALQSALELSNDPEYDPESAEKYGLWDVPKTYFHLYAENQIVMDWDTPYESMGGLTPFEMTKRGFACHLSQQYLWFPDWISPAKASGIRNYSPCRFGLYRSTVGEDVEKNDFLENITPYAVQIARKEEEERLAREEAERLKQEEEEQRRQAEEEQHRQAEEEYRKQEEASRALESTATEPAEVPATPAAGISGQLIFLVLLDGVLIVLLIIVLIQLRQRTKNSGSK